MLSVGSKSYIGKNNEDDKLIRMDNIKLVFDKEREILLQKS